MKRFPPTQLNGVILYLFTSHSQEMSQKSPLPTCHTAQLLTHIPNCRPVYTQTKIRVHCFFFIAVFSTKVKSVFISFPFHFVFNEHNLKIIPTWLPEKWQILRHCSGNTSLTSNCLIQYRDYTKHNTETDTTAPRGCKTYTYATENPKLDIFRTGKQMNCKTCLDFFFFTFSFLYAENFGVQNMPRSYK